MVDAIATTINCHIVGDSSFRPLTGGVAMTEDPSIIQMNIDRYSVMLKGAITTEQRFVIERLLAEARISAVTVGNATAGG
jgi:hypothetical protein